MELAEICQVAVKKGASDIHIKVGLPPVVRVNGALQPLPSTPRLTNEEVGRMAWAIMSPAQRDRFKATLDLDMSWQVQGLGRFRVNVFRQRQNVGMVLRAIPTDPRTIDELGLAPVLKEIAAAPRGLVLVTGTTGSGKSTTLAAIVEEINRTQPHHVLTIEDPIEFMFRERRCVINQREIGVDSESFAAALRAALRQDPDVILVGELRDRDSVEIALQAAETGHLVLSTTHTLDAPETVHRLVGVFEPHHQQHVRYQLASVLTAVVSQRLLPARAGGRIAALEIMRNTGTVSECIGDPTRLKEIPDHIASGHKLHGTQTFDQSVYRLLKAGLVDQDIALRYASNPDDMMLRLKGIGGEDWD